MSRDVFFRDDYRFRRSLGTAKTMRDFSFDPTYEDIENLPDEDHPAYLKQLIGTNDLGCMETAIKRCLNADAFNR